MVESAASPLGSLESRYRPLLELGRGGTARVYLAKSRLAGLRKLVVLKTLEPELSMNVEMRDLFRREAEVCARLNHPNIVQVHEVVEEVTGPIIVMEYLEGVALSQTISRSEGRFDKRLYLHAITQLLAGLHYFHELRDYDRTTALNAIHRDVSPQNVILLYEGAVKVLDFGIAKLATEDQSTRTGIVKGKLHYMPAEQLLSDGAIDRRADIFSAGVMLWEALAERRMWLGHTENTVMRSLISGKLPKLREVAPGFPSYFYDVVARATASEPSARYPTALAMQLDVERILGDLGGPVHPRELSEFMRAEFGEYRQQREAAIEAAMHQSIPPLAVVSSHETTPTRQDRFAPGEPSLSDVIATQPSLGIRRVMLIALIVVLSGLGVGLFVRKQSRIGPQVAPSIMPSVVQASVVHLAVASRPSGAAVRLDGNLVGNTPYTVELPLRKQKATIELSAENYEPVTRIVSLDEDLAMEIQLQPIPATNNAPAENSDRKKVSKHAKAAPSSMPTSNATAAHNCSPPYTLSPDGIRTYKAECFKEAAPR